MDRTENLVFSSFLCVITNVRSNPLWITQTSSNFSSSLYVITTARNNAVWSLQNIHFFFFQFSGCHHGRPEQPFVDHADKFYFLFQFSGCNHDRPEQCRVDGPEKSSFSNFLCVITNIRSNPLWITQTNSSFFRFLGVITIARSNAVWTVRKINFF